MEYYNEHRRELEKWCDTNFISYANELVELLLEKEIIEYDDIENLYIDDSSEPQEIMQWFLVTKEGYEKFKKMNFPVLKIKELYLYGRTGCGQAVVLDFYYMQNNIKIALDLA